jgi:hypothetical protein
MAAVLFTDLEGKQHYRRFGAPKKATLNAWWDAARKACKVIPGRMGWVIVEQHMTVQSIRIKITNGQGATLDIGIDRTAPSM